jgi:nicotinamide-nucleotide amidase
MNPVLEIFSQGEEIIRGQIVDTNAAWLSEQAVQIGFTVTRHTAVGDNLGDLVALLQEIAQRADCCLCTGGLGPTSDDLTTEAVASAFDLPLVFDEIAYAQMQHYFAHRNRPMPESNIKQAMLPTGSVRLDNDLGTAPGFAFKYQRCWFAFMPGVPSEMRQMYLEKILPTLQNRFLLHPERLVTLRTLGLGESAIQQSLKDISIPDEVQLGFRAAEDVQVKLLFPFDYPEIAVQDLINEVANCLGDYVFAIEGLGYDTGDLIATIDKLMMQGNHNLAVLETASQGLLAAKCMLCGWLVSGSYEQSLARVRNKFAIADDNDDVLAIAKSAARNMQQQAVDFALVQLYTESRSILHDKNKIIVVHTVLLAGDEYHHATHSIAGTAQRKQNYSALMSLDVLRRYFLLPKR